MDSTTYRKIFAPGECAALAARRVAHPRGALSRIFPRFHRPNTQTPVETTKKKRSTRVWTPRDGRPAPIEIQPGASDGLMTQVLGGDLAAGTPLIIETIGPAS